MKLDRLHIRGVRNLTECSLEFNPRLNVIVGPNGSGKSSILEAIYLLGRGKSFRSSHSRRIVKHGQSELTVFASISDKASGKCGIGVQILDGRLVSKVNGQFLNQSSKLASLVPLLLINPDADKLIQGSPRLRRRFLDWGLFHVEQVFFGVWQRYNRALQQRNAALREAKASIDPWNIQLIDVGMELHSLRQRYARDMSLVAQSVFTELAGVGGIQFTYQCGWPKDMTLSNAMAEQLESDRRAGFTQRGPHRADLVMTVDGKRANDILSGGQQKLAACALIIGQAKIFSKKRGDSCLLLIDDLPAELDATRRNTLMRLLAGTGCQLFVTTTDARSLELSSWGDVALFHVEHGAVVV